MTEHADIIEFVDSIWGAYDIPLRRDGVGWRATGLAFHAWHRRGDESVRMHLL